MSMQPGPVATFKVIESKLFPELLMRLYADPTDHAHRGEPLDRDVDWQVRLMIYSLSCRPALADASDLTAKRTPHAVLRCFCDRESQTDFGRVDHLAPRTAIAYSRPHVIRA